MSEAQYPFKPEGVTPAPAKAGAGRSYGGLRAWATLLIAGSWVVASGGAPSSGANGVPLTWTSSLENRDGPMPGYTGGFGEKTCHFCHFQDSLNLTPGKVSITGQPDRWEAGRAYPITVTVTRPRMDLGGFQLTARFEDGGAQAGMLEVRPEDGARVKITTDKNVQYIHHVRAGAVEVAPDTARWTVHWTAPSAGAAVAFHVAANAASDDDSPLGDYIYTTSVRSLPPER